MHENRYRNLFRHVNDRRRHFMVESSNFWPWTTATIPRRRENHEGHDPHRPVFAFIGNVGTPTAEVSVPLVLEHKRGSSAPFTGAGLLRRDPPDR